MKKILTILSACVIIPTMISCEKQTTDGPTNNEGEGNKEEAEYTVDAHGYATFTHEGFDFKIKLEETQTSSGKKPSNI